MARKSLIEKEKRRTILIGRHFEKRQSLKKIINDQNVGVEEKQAAVFALTKLPRDSSPCRKRNRCMFTGRARGYYRKFKISRLCLREMANQGLIPGMYKASW
jgi:small subunit ribosomal protein S14